MKYIVYNQQGKEIGQTLLPKEIFDVKVNSDLIHQVAVSQMSNQRIVVAHTKDRGEVRGGGIKPWRQKGTGRARHGSRRSPLWRGGGVTFGPTKDRVFKKKINKKMKKKALFMVLSGKVKNNLLIVLDELRLEEAKTKSLAKLIENWKLSRICRGSSVKTELPFMEAKVKKGTKSSSPSEKIDNFKESSVLIALPKADKNIVLAAKNLPRIEVIEARNLNVLDLLSFKYLTMPKEAIKVIKETFSK
ncbi:MAG: 50S ribosomal protein L4 [Candidatus Nealsonbacteria bacterium]|nr:50S ribosomal protein L4 [Candidatus Nealsonbacteria bacterium]